MHIEFDTVMCCIPRDLAIARLAVDGVAKNVKTKKILILTRASAFAACRNVLGEDVDLIDERDCTGGMSLEQLCKRGDIYGFPKRASWYFQQFVKLGYSLLGSSDGYYLIWDCDTIPLRPIAFFTEDGRPLYTMAEENHAPYFDTYERLFGYRPEYTGSFISQHIMVNSAIAREMIRDISQRHAEAPSWSWAIINNLARVKSGSLFSEYETYGNYVKSKYPDRIASRHLEWLREGAAYAKSVNPTPRQLNELAEKYDYAAFENWHLSLPRRILRWVRNYRRS
jgi:hypothetical protein